MSFSDIFMITDNAVVSGIIWFVVLTIIFYLARNHAHRAIISVSRILHNAMRVSAHSVMLAEKNMIQRNTEVLLAQGREASERMVEREFERVDATVRRDLAEYPALHRHLSEEITKIDEDYNQSIEVPPSPPGTRLREKSLAVPPPPPLGRPLI